jgi:hypothetical protein
LLEKLMRWVFAVLCYLCVAVASPGAPAPSVMQCDDPKLSAPERAGCRIWYFASAGNGRFQTYVLQQRFPVLPDWYKVLRSDARGRRFHKWGLINDPQCCTPGEPNCPKKSLAETYGFDYCPGDDALLQYVGKPGYKDPACDPAIFQDAPAGNDPHSRQRQNPCDLEFGTSTGAMGLRKFPNPRFNAEAWKKLNGWEGYTAKVQPDFFHSKLRDGSVEPPYLIGMACGACHIAFDPLKPPANPEHPKPENLIGAIGNQYAKIHDIVASGEARSSPVYRIFNYTRPGTVDTSAFPHDFITNPGTPNAIFNIAQRPNFPHEEFQKWYQATICPANSDDEKCWCEPGKPGKCWEKRLKRASDPMDPNDPVKHILKGGEDTIGLLEALQRVYINIGSCSETCWMNHLTSFFALDPNMRNYGQTPFDIGQCRADCPNFRAIEDRLPEIAAFLLTSRTPELYQAKGLKSRDQLIQQLDAKYGKDSVALGRKIFAEQCARCHSSQKPGPNGDFTAVDFHKTDESGNRIDWMGNDESIMASEVGTNRSRALHSNHMAGHVWAEFGSITMHNRAPDPNIPDPHDGGRGYYRPASLLGAWATAPFLHNNAMGPELCGDKQEGGNLAPYLYVDRDGKSLYFISPGKLKPGAPKCWEFDPSVDGRYRLFEASMAEMLTAPQNRQLKSILLDGPIQIDIGPRMWDKKQSRFVGPRVVIPVGTPQAEVSDLLYKDLVVDMVLSYTNRSTLLQKYGADKAALDTLDRMRQELMGDLTRPLSVLGKPEYQTLIKSRYMTSTDMIDNLGHPFGTALPDREKKALIAFLATL